jgi:iron(III) transport system ATP-binding protein
MIEIRNLTKRFTTDTEVVLAMDHLNLEVEPHSFFTLLGPSGCGKSTLLRCIAGLESPDEGEILIADRLVYSSTKHINLPPNKRLIGMVFQSYAIWPHMTVFQNVAFPLEVRRIGDVKRRVMEALEVVGLEHVSDRFASRLSGGQQQRIAFARAVVAEPELLLLDEPLSNLDATLREQMRSELRRFQEQIGITTIYVTHDQAEALSMSDKIAVMQSGRFMEIGAPEDLYDRPTTGFTARFLGGANIVDGVVEQSSEGLAVRTSLGLLYGHSTSSFSPGDKTSVFIRPERIRPATNVDVENAGTNTFEVIVRAQHFIGDGRELEFDVAGVESIRLNAKFPPREPVVVGDVIQVRVDRSDVLLLVEAK